MNNILLIAGTGRNVGKTLLACEIISHLSKTTDVLGIKISSHLHALEKGQKIIANTPNYQVSEELMESDKDSSRMKQAGAKRVFFILSSDYYLIEAFNYIENEISGVPVICESGGLRRFINPGLFILVRGESLPDNKKYLLDYNPVIVTYNPELIGLSLSTIHFRENNFFIES